MLDEITRRTLAGLLDAIAEDLRLVERIDVDASATAFARDVAFVRRAVVLRLPAGRWLDVLDSLVTRATGDLAVFAVTLREARALVR